MAKSKKLEIDPDKLSADEQRRVRRALFPRNATLSLHFNEGDIAAWRKRAEACSMGITEWIERTLNDAVGR